jgi:hypothetical protein
MRDMGCAVIKPKATKPKKCKVCPSMFTPSRMGQKVCGALCALTFARSVRAKDEKREAIRDRVATKAKLEAMKGRGYWIAQAQTAFNSFIRERDKQAGYPCISSGRPLDWNGNAVDAGHYRSRGSAPHLRFDERNCHAQSKQENRYASGNVVGYRLGLIARYGLEYVEALEADQAPRNYSIDDLKAIKTTYAAKVREIKARQE